MKDTQMETAIIYNVYVLDDEDRRYDICGEFNTIKEAREYINSQMAEDAQQLINDKYAIYINVETFLE